ncbi:Cytochrome P450 [compost metagenome]
MAILDNELNTINFVKHFSYSKAAPKLVSNGMGTADEIARWVLDRNAILYKDALHAPVISQSKIHKVTRRGESNGPALQMTDALIYSTDSIISFWEERCLPKNRLLPAEIQAKEEVLDLYHLFTGPFFKDKVTKYEYAQLLTTKKMAKTIFKERISFLESLRVTLTYPFIKRAIIKKYNLHEGTNEDYLSAITTVFNQVDDLLKDGRRYLTGDEFTLADLAFVACAAPMILPVEFGGVLPTISQIPDSYRKAVYNFRASAAGQFVLRIYQEDRPVMLPQSELPAEPNFLGKLIKRIMISLGKKKYKLFYFLQKRFPVLRLPFVKLATVNRNDLLVEMMTRDLDFTIEEINSKKMSDQKGAFFLGMDRNNPQFDRERDFVRKATRKDDLELIRSFIRSSSDEILRHSMKYGKVDVANSYCKVILVRLIDHYFGVSAPTETMMKMWLRDLFYDLFLNFTNNKTKHQEALTAANERKNCLLEIIKDRKQDLKDGKTLDDNLFNRLIIMQQEPGNEWVDDDCLQRNIGGLITGILETTNKSVILILDELFNRKDSLKDAIEVAKAEDMNKMYGYVCEALRFNPAQPGVIRFNENEQLLSGKGTKNYRIKPKRKVFALTAAAMFDPAAFPNPKQFIGDRNATYMNYGFALHECYGKYINAVTLSEFTAAILRLKNVRRAPGRVGRGTGITIESFPNNFVVEFD